jgi:hypothetical protein
MYYFFLFQDSLGKDFEDIDSCSTGDNDDDIFIESDQVEGCFDGKEEYLENTIDNSIKKIMYFVFTAPCIILMCRSIY